MEKIATSQNTAEKVQSEKLSKYLTMSLTAYRQGKPNQLNDIFEELLSETAKIEFIKMWLNVFCRKLIDSLKDPSHDTLPLIDFILHKSKWLNSNSIHTQVFDLYEKFCMTLISLNNKYLPVIIKILLQNFVPKEMYEELESGHRQSALKIAEKQFASVSDLKIYVGSILRDPSYTINSPGDFAEVDSEHMAFLMDLFHHHPKSRTKLKNVQKILVGYSAVGIKNPTKCFFIQKSNHEREDISYVKACNTAGDEINEQRMSHLLKISQEDLISKIIDMLVKIMNFYPMSISLFETTLSETFPHRRLNESIQKKFEKVKLAILTLCFEKMILIDVEIKAESWNHHHKAHENNVEMAKKLDWLILTMLDYIDHNFDFKKAENALNTFGTIRDISKMPKSEVEEYRDGMLDKFIEYTEIFEKSLLVTYQPKYVQFVYFYLCSMVEKFPDFIQTFLSILIENIRDEQKTKLIRINSTNYLASMIARAKYIDFGIVKATIKFLLGFLENYCKKFAEDKKADSFKVPKDACTIQQEGFEMKKSAFNFSSAVYSNNMKKYKTYNDLMSPSMGFNLLREKFQQHEIYYYTVMAIMYIYCYKVDEFVKHSAFDGFDKFLALLLKHEDKLTAIKILPTKILRRFHNIVPKLPKGYPELRSKLEDELSKELNSTKLHSTRPKFVEEYFPFDPHFLNFSKKVLIESYVLDKDNVADSESGLLFEESPYLFSNLNDDSNPLKYINEIPVNDNYNESNSDGGSYFSKIDTEASAENLKLQQQNQQQLLKKRKYEPAPNGITHEVSKKIKTSNQK